jgi:hypothetical protein
VLAARPQVRRCSWTADTIAKYLRLVLLPIGILIVDHFDPDTKGPTDEAKVTNLLQTSSSTTE